MATKVNLMPCETSEMELLPKVVTGCRAEFRIYQTSKMEPQKELKTKNR